MKILRDWVKNVILIYSFETMLSIFPQLFRQCDIILYCKVIFESCLMVCFSCIFWMMSEIKFEKQSFMKQQKANARSVGLGGSQKLKVESAEIINKTEMQILSKLLVYETFFLSPCTLQICMISLDT